jgi:cell filamentation protein
MATESDKERAAREGLFTTHRAFELARDPVVGKFDEAHLREVNRRLFQDLPKSGYTDVTPGQYRPAVPAGEDWFKPRFLENNAGVPLFVAYSAMDDKSRQDLADTLASIDPTAMSKLKTAAFTKTMGDLYAKLDYLHPFPDGNSRTLRVFTQQLAKTAGYDLDWARFTASPGGRSTLYVARDTSVNRLALPHVQSHETRRFVISTMDRLEGNRDLQDLLRDAIRPMRAKAFEKLTEGEALREHPELQAAYETLRMAVDYSRTKFPNNATERHDFQEGVRAVILQRLDAGETKEFKAPGQVKTANKEPPIRDQERSR